MLVVPGCSLLLRMRGDQRRVDVDRQGLRRARELPEPLTRRGVRGADRVQQPRCRCDPRDRPKRGRVRRHLAKQRLLLSDRAQVRHALAAVGKHHRQIADHPTQIMPTTTTLDARKTRRQRVRQPHRVRHLPKQRSPGVRDQARSVRRDFYRSPTSVTHHPQGDLQSSRFATFDKPKNPCCAGRSRALGHPEGAGLTAGSGLIRCRVVRQALPNGRLMHAASSYTRRAGDG